MTKAGKILFSFSFLALILLGAARWVYGGWHPALWVPFGLWFILGGTAVILERRYLLEFFTMRTTKHGANLGVLVLAAVILLGCLNFLSVRYDKRFDWTSDHLNSLSDLSVSAARALRQDTELVLVYRKDQAEGDLNRQVKDIAEMYRNVAPKIKFVSYEALTNPAAAQKYEFTTGAYVFYATQGERRVKIDPPTEEGITRALTKFARETKKAIYFTRGHGELLLEDKDANGLSDLNEELSVTYETKPLVLFENKNRVPDDAAVVAVIGPKQQFLDEELNALREFARRGGHLLLALDPGTRHNLALLTKTFGVEFSNDFVLDMRSRALQSTPSLVLGTDLSKTNAITKAFPAGTAITLFELASSLKKAPDAPATLKLDEFIKTDKSTASFPELKEKLEYRENGPHTLAIAVTGTLPAVGAQLPDAPLANKEFSAVIFGDSNFLGNRLLHNNLNRDLAGNSFAWLTNDTDLISIRPKEAKGTTLNMPRESYYLLILGLLGITIVMFGSGFSLWWRRRTA